MLKEEKYNEVENNTKNKVLGKIGPGDIIFEVEIQSNGKLFPIHTWIHVSGKPEIAHASVGRKLIAVTRHDMDRYVANTRSVVMLRGKNELFTTLLIQVGERFPLILNPIELEAAAQLKLETNNLKSTIPLKEAKLAIPPYSLMRFGDNIKELNTFRAVRAALRTGMTTGNNVLPLSKKKGVSCDEFVGYTIQSALVILLLRDKVNELQPMVDAISAERRKKDSSGNKNPATNLLHKFHQEFIALAEKHSQLPEEIKKQEVLDILASPIKGIKINNSLHFWLATDLFEKTVGAFSLHDPRKIVNPLFSTVMKNTFSAQDSDEDDNNKGWWSDEADSVPDDTKSEDGSEPGKDAFEELDQLPELLPQKASFNLQFFSAKDDLILVEKSSQTSTTPRSKSFSD